MSEKKIYGFMDVEWNPSIDVFEALAREAVRARKAYMETREVSRVLKRELPNEGSVCLVLPTERSRT